MCRILGFSIVLPDNDDNDVVILADVIYSHTHTHTGHSVAWRQK